MNMLIGFSIVYVTLGIITLIILIVLTVLTVSIVLNAQTRKKKNVQEHLSLIVEKKLVYNEKPLLCMKGNDNSRPQKHISNTFDLVEDSKDSEEAKDSKNCEKAIAFHMDMWSAQELIMSNEQNKAKEIPSKDNLILVRATGRKRMFLFFNVETRQKDQQQPIAGKQDFSRTPMTRSVLEAIDEMRAMRVVDARGSTTISRKLNVYCSTPSEAKLTRIILGCMNNDIIGDVNIDLCTNGPDRFINEGFHCVLMSLNDPILTFIRGFKNINIELLSCKGIDFNICRHFIPYYTISNVDVASIFDRSSGNGDRIQCISFEYGIWAKNIDKTALVNDMCRNIDRIEDHDLNFYAQFFATQNTSNFTKETHINRIAKTRIEKSVGGRIVIYGQLVDPYAKPGDVIIMYGERWVIDLNMNLENSFKSQFHKATITSQSQLYMNIDIQNIPDVYEQVYFEDIQTMGTIVDHVGPISKVVIRLSDSIFRDDSVNAKKYLCYEKQELEYDFQCDEKGYFWDRPCQGDVECPFFDPSRNRGGCEIKTGSCELPVGVKKKGFRFFEKSSSPLCHSCPISNPYCCNGDPYLVAFPMDQFSSAS